MKRGKPKKRIFLIMLSVIILLFLLIFFGFFYSKKCPTKECFLENLWKCKPVIYEEEGWKFRIIMPLQNKCIVKVSAKNPQLGLESASRLKDRSMKCTIPKEIAGTFMPHERIEYCEGNLKESIQSLMIEKMHLYIVQNIGKINESFMPY